MNKGKFPSTHKIVTVIWVIWDKFENNNNDKDIYEYNRSFDCYQVKLSISIDNKLTSHIGSEMIFVSDSRLSFI